jgi:hypothetical protein
MVIMGRRWSLEVGDGETVGAMAVFVEASVVSTVAEGSAVFTAVAAAGSMAVAAAGTEEEGIAKPPSF